MGEIELRFGNNRLLIISHSYNNFVKAPVEYTATFFDFVHVLVRYNPIANISKYIPISTLDRFKLDSKIDLRNKPSNIRVYPTPILYAPITSQYKKLGKKHFKVVSKTIQKHKIKFDLVHCHFLWSAGYVGAEFKKKYQIPFVVTAHGYDIYDLPFRDDEWREKIEYVLNIADYVITVSGSNLKCIRKLNIKTPVKVIPNGFRSDFFYPKDSKDCRKSLNLSLNKKIILTVGNLVEAKGHKYLIETMKEIVKHRKHVLCIIIGSGKLKNKLESQIKILGLKNYIELGGEKPHYEIPIWMSACDIFVLPSLSEGNPTVMFECLGCGKPFIGTEVGGVPEIITSEDYGLLVAPKNTRDLTEEILIGLDKKWDHGKIRDYAERFTWENITKDILNVYDTLLMKK